jgi:GTPase SAR1 family protein
LFIQQVKRKWIEELEAAEAKESARKGERHALQPAWDRTWKSGRGLRDGKFRCVVLVGNKSDLDSNSQRRVNKDEGQAMAKELGIEFRECSAKSGNGVEEVMFDLVRIVRHEVIIYTKTNDKELTLEEEPRRKQERKKTGLWKRLTTRSSD